MKKKHAAAVARANEARQEVARLQGVLDRAQAELAGIGIKYGGNCLECAQGCRWRRAGSYRRRIELQEAVKVIPAAIKAAQDEVRARHLVAEGLADALTESRVEAEREALRKKVMGAMAEGGSIEAAARAVGITVQEAKSVLPASAIGGTPAARRGENPRDFRDLRG